MDFSPKKYFSVLFFLAVQVYITTPVCKIGLNEISTDQLGNRDGVRGGKRYSARPRTLSKAGFGTDI
jgi:hypothetical protein